MAYHEASKWNDAWDARYPSIRSLRIWMANFGMEAARSRPRPTVLVEMHERASRLLDEGCAALSQTIDWESAEVLRERQRAEKAERELEEVRRKLRGIQEVLDGARGNPLASGLLTLLR